MDSSFWLAGGEGRVTEACGHLYVHLSQAADEHP